MPARLFVLFLVLSAVSLAQDTNFPVGPQYLITTGSTLFLHPIATPSLSLSEGLPAVTAPAEPAPAPSTSPSAVQTPSLTDFSRIYWGSGNAPEPTSEIEINSAALPRNLPASLFDSGVTGMTDASSLRQRGYGVTLGEVAVYWKSHKRQAPRVFTNADVVRLRG
ncbi:MAG TPA: hypothetical protein VE377_01525 [Candidatus Dormibacteraeota bacterium]|nr:hypothetical protein [Candidatus Dormibacteraeota bacterium]